MLFFLLSACRHFSSSVSGDRPPLEMKTTPSQGLTGSAEVFGGVENRKHKIQDKEREEKKKKLTPIDCKAFNLFNNSAKALHGDCCTKTRQHSEDTRTHHPCIFLLFLQTFDFLPYTSVQHLRFGFKPGDGPSPAPSHHCRTCWCSSSRGAIWCPRGQGASPATSSP